MPRFSAYQGAQRRARLAAGSLADHGVKAILEDLRREVARLSAQLASLPVGTPQARVRAIEASVQIVDAMHQRLLVAGNRAVAGRRSVAFSEIAAIWQEAAERTARAQGIPLAKLGAIRQPPLTLLGSYESLGGAASTWRTALRRSVEASRVDLNLIVREAIGAQVHPEQLARSLRPYVVGAEPFHQAFPESVVTRVRDLRPSLPPGTREAARTMAYNARRIAYSEIHNARAEAEVTHFAVDPLVSMVHWTLSPFRGQVAVPDVCVPPGTMIATPRGEVAIEAVSIGDAVLTHEGRYRTVTRLYRRTIRGGQLVRLRCRVGQSRTLDLTLTPNHPVLTATGWRPAGDLRTGTQVLTFAGAQPAHDGLSPCGTAGTTSRGSGESAPSLPAETDVSGRCGALPPARSRTARTRRRGDPGTTPRCRCEVGTGQRATPRPASSDSPRPCVRVTAAPESLPAWSTSPSGVAHDSDSPPRASASGTPQPYTPSRSSEVATTRAPRRTGRSAESHGAPGAFVLGAGTLESSSAADALGCASPAPSRRMTRTSLVPETYPPQPGNGGRKTAVAGDEPVSIPGWARGTVHNALSYVQYKDNPPARQWSEVVSVERIAAIEQDVLNLGVDEDHSYVAGGVVVHNCDMLATANWYGLGPGMYPVGKVPVPPHPFDRSIAAWTPVLTARGWRRVDAVRAGESVWTHRGRWGRVTESLAGRVTAGWLVLTTADGRTLTVTDDHPVLLASGAWRLAGQLRGGETLVVSRDRPHGLVNEGVEVGAVTARRRLPVEHEQRPPGRGEGLGLGSVGGALPAGAVPAAVNLDGDAVGGDREVEVVPAERIECFEGDAQGLLEDGLLVLTEALVPVDGLGLLPQGRLRVWRAPRMNAPDADGALSALGGAHALADEPVGGDDAAPGDAPLDEPRADGAAIDAESFADGVLADLLGDVPALDLCTVELVNVRALHMSLRRWCLTVANDKSFVAGGLVIHNCERMPVTRSAADLDEPKPNPVRQLAGAQARVPSLFRGSVTAAQEQRVREQAETVMRATDSWAAQSGMDTLTMVPALIASGR